ncbi:helix-turn-helix transcriptional regulator [Nocardiopsis sp. HNM0947]|uniref:Helix-turn-helix transcriptional regulator n=1 Tax=Nocardiopsis coralli TaxID=2772213 RepID=A0ABR9P3Y5_9ACTN|nr:TetR/AcrR family transcriptional regulator [Nocardiopsis coralli]MBE2998527.1 helix-turn-helix transcriptional regulator [Nocardiopsis coralli]
MVNTAQADSGETRTRARTRRTILQAAVEVLGTDRSAPLSEVARAAGVSRSTLQRYFPERVDLVRALDQHVWELVDEATERARPTEGTAIEALERLVAELFELRAPVMLVASDADPEGECDDGEGEDQGEQDSSSDLAMYDLVERGHEDGTVDPRITPLWFKHLLWATLYTGWGYGASARVSSYEALRLTVHSFLKAVERR